MDILIVEDDKSVIRDLKSYLESLGHKVVSIVSNGKNQFNKWDIYIRI
ncbi:hypothetical protein MBMB1_1402 [Methanobacterium sp. MB1]|nr:hypothetical protein MBMB1_1402 [Methanobacterium sp. MB1]